MRRADPSKRKLRHQMKAMDRVLKRGKVMKKPQKIGSSD
jgi:hypothetical protein